MAHPIEIVTGQQALDRLANPSFEEAWRDLHQACPWATVFQGPRFVGTWYRTYARSMTPLVLLEWREGRLDGLLPLALQTDGSGLIVAGWPQAEYQAWLTPCHGDPGFLSRALEALRSTHSGHGLTFTYLPPGAPLDHITGSPLLGPLSTVEIHRRPLLQIDAAAVATSLKKKSNKSKFSRLRRLGEVRIERIATESDLAVVLDEIIWQYDLRQGAINQTTPFRTDPFKREFLLALMRDAPVLHVTVLRAGSDLVAAQINYRDRDRLCLGIVSHSPLHAEHSPGKLHMMLLAQELAREGIDVIDLTPGEDEWKERFATAHDTVYEVTIHPSRAARMGRRVVKRVRAAAKSTARRFGIEPAKLRHGVKRVLSAIRRRSQS